MRTWCQTAGKGGVEGSRISLRSISNSEGTATPQGSTQTDGAASGPPQFRAHARLRFYSPFTFVPKTTNNASAGRVIFIIIITIVDIHSTPDEDKLGLARNFDRILRGGWLSRTALPLRHCCLGLDKWPYVWDMCMPFVFSFRLMAFPLRGERIPSFLSVSDHSQHHHAETTSEEILISYQSETM